MIAHQNQRQRLQEVHDALDNLASGKRLYRRELFPEGVRRSWHNGFLARLIKEELVIRHVGNNLSSTQYEAVDGAWFKTLIADDVKLAQWYFTQPLLLPGLEVADTPPPAKEDPPSDPVNDWAQYQRTGEFPRPPPLETKEEPPQDPADVPSQILSTLIMCAENLVLIRSQISGLHEKVDALSSEVAALKSKR